MQHKCKETETMPKRHKPTWAELKRPQRDATQPQRDRNDHKEMQNNHKRQKKKLQRDPTGDAK